MDEIETLRGVTIFSTMDDQELSALRKMMGSQTYMPGQVIIREGEPGDMFHVITQGTVHFVTSDAKGQELLLGKATAGGFFGELAMLTGEPRSVRVKAAEHTQTLTLGREDTHSFLGRQPHAAIDMLTEMARRLDVADRMIRSSVVANVNSVADSKQTVGEKIADMFAAMMGSWGFIIFQTTVLAFWVTINLLQATHRIHWDEYPFIFLNLALSFQAAYSAPIIMMSQNRSSNKDRIAAEIDHETNVRAEVKASMIINRLDDLDRMLGAMKSDRLEG